MSIPILPQPTTALDADGNPIQTYGLNGTRALYTVDQQNRWLQEQMLLMQQAALLSTQLANEKTARYTTIEVR